jgi:hypothetical protein
MTTRTSYARSDGYGPRGQTATDRRIERERVLLRAPGMLAWKGWPHGKWRAASSGVGVARWSSGGTRTEVPAGSDAGSHRFDSPRVNPRRGSRLTRREIHEAKRRDPRHAEAAAPDTPPRSAKQCACAPRAPTPARHLPAPCESRGRALRALLSAGAVQGLGWERQCSRPEPNPAPPGSASIRRGPPRTRSRHVRRRAGGGDGGPREIGGSLQCRPVRPGPHRTGRRGPCPPARRRPRASSPRHAPTAAPIARARARNLACSQFPRN